VAKALAGEVYPGEILRDSSGRKFASTITIFPVVAAGGRAVYALPCSGTPLGAHFRNGIAIADDLR